MRTISPPATAALSFVQDRATFHDFSPGPTEETRNPLDVAIDGGGFLAVQTPAGERYTRDGALQINNQGQLVTASGYQVLGNSGPIVFQPTDKQINIASDGNVTVIEGTSRIEFGARQASHGLLRPGAAAGEGRLQPLRGRRRVRPRSPTPRRDCARASSKSPTSTRCMK